MAFERILLMRSSTRFGTGICSSCGAIRSLPDDGLHRQIEHRNGGIDRRCRLLAICESAAAKADYVTLSDS